MSNIFNIFRRHGKRNLNIIFTRADKGNITVAWNKNEYFNKIEELLHDHLCDYGQKSCQKKLKIS